jgi:hypothetical protein
MTVDSFRRIAMSMPAAAEGSHMDHPDFRVKGRIFATLPPSRDDEDLGMVKLTPEQQRQFIKAKPGVFVPCQGAWGARGCTYVRLGDVDRSTLRRAVLTAWRNTAPKRMVAELGTDDPD